MAIPSEKKLQKLFEGLHKGKYLNLNISEVRSLLYSPILDVFRIGVYTDSIISVIFRIDEEGNELPLTRDEFSPHIQKIVEKYWNKTEDKSKEELASRINMEWIWNETHEENSEPFIDYTYEYKLYLQSCDECKGY